MSLKWSDVIAPEIVARVKRNDRIRVTKKGYFNYNQDRFFVLNAGKSGRWISTERAIFEGIIQFEYSYAFTTKFFERIADTEHGFLMAMMPLINNQSLRAGRVLTYLAENHPPGRSDVSRNIIDPFFASMLDDIESYIKQKLKTYVTRQVKP